MRMTKKVVSLILAVMMLATMIVVGTVSASAATQITTAQQLYAACQNGGEYELANDIELDYWTANWVEANTTINGNGHTIKAVDDDTWMFVWGDDQNACLTLSNVTLDGNGKAITAVWTRAQQNVNDNANCKVTMTGCTVKNFVGTSYYGAVMLFSHSKGDFTNCTFINNTTPDGRAGNNLAWEGSDIWAGAATTVTITGCTFSDSVFVNADSGNDASVTVTDSSVDTLTLEVGSNGHNASANINNSTVIVNCNADDGNTVTVDNDSAVVVKDSNGDVDGIRSSNVITTEQELKDAAAAGGNYVLGNNITYTSGAWVNVMNDFNLNLGGYTITSDDSVFVTKNGADLTVNNGTLVSTVDKDYAIYVNSGSVFTLGADAKLEKNTRTGWCGAVIARAGSTTNVYGEIEAADYGIYTQGSAVANVYDGAKITSTDAAALSGNGSGGNEGYTMNVYGGELTSINDVAIYHPNQGTLNVTGGTITGATAVYIKSGTTKLGDGTSISGGTFVGNGAAAAYTPSGDGTNPTGDAIVVDNCGYPGGAPDVDITGGTFTSVNAEAVASYAKTGYEPIDEIITGGTFSSDIDDLTADGFVGVKNADGTYGVSTEADVLDGNVYIDGYQNKAVDADAEGNGVRILTKIDRDWLEDNADEYGYVVAKVSGKDQDNADFSKLTVDGGNGQKVIDCTDTYNDGIDGIDNTYVTLAVNGMSDTNQVAARFYVVVNGKTYYANYVNVATYDGIIATYNA